MKTKILTAALLLAGIGLMAQDQQSSTPAGPTQTDKQLINHILSQQSAHGVIADRPTGIKQRVIAQSIINSNNEQQDSFTYKYSGTHSSNYNFDKTDLEYNIGYQTDFIQSDVWITPLNSDLQADSILSYYQNSLNRISTASYRDDNKLNAFYKYSFYGTQDVTEKTFHIYNAQGLLTQTAHLSNEITLELDTVSTTKYFYNTANQAVIDTFYGQDFDPEIHNRYFYNSQNMIDTVRCYMLQGIMYISNMISLKYTYDNKIKFYKNVTYGPAGDIQQTFTDTFGYTPNIPYFTSFYSMATDASNDTVFQQAITKSVGTNDLPDSMRMRTFSGNFLIQDLSLKYSYNDYNNPVMLEKTSLINNNNSFAGQINFYYETFDDTPPTSGINDVKNNEDIRVYPNPFADRIYIDWKQTGRSKFKLSLINMLGQVAYSASQTLLPGKNAIELPKLSSGNYMALIQDSKGNTWSSQLVKE